MGVLGFEPRTSSLSEMRSNQLSYTPFKKLKINGAKGVRTLDLQCAKLML
jgi:hypothetical protein